MPETTTTIVTASATKTHVAVLAFPFGTHAAPLFSIISHLASSTPNTHFSFLNTSKSNTSVSSSNVAKDVSNVKTHNVADGIPKGYVLNGNPMEEIEFFMKSAQENFKRGVKEAEAEVGRKVSCLVTDAFLWFGGDMATEMGVDWVSYWTAGTCSLSAHLYTDVLRKAIEVQDVSRREDESLSFVPGMANILIKDLPEGILYGNIDSYFSQMLYKMSIALPNATSVFMNSFEELDPVATNNLKLKLNNFLSVGPINLINPPLPSLSPDSYKCLAWLDKHDPATVAYISFGPFDSLPSEECRALAEGLEACKVPFLWSLKKEDLVHLPDEFIEKTKGYGLVVPWVQHLEILSHKATGVFITHSGWTSLLDSIAGGVPIICRPFLGDQTMNGRMIQTFWQVGIKLEGGRVSKSGIVNSLDIVLAQDQGKKMKEKIEELRGLALKAVDAYGSSTNNFEALLKIVTKN